MVRVITVNTNGIRAAARKGFFSWLETQQADVNTDDTTAMNTGEGVESNNTNTGCMPLRSNRGVPKGPPAPRATAPRQLRGLRAPSAKIPRKLSWIRAPRAKIPCKSRGNHAPRAAIPRKL